MIGIEGLRKEYRHRGGSTVAVDGLDLQVPEGTVFGFLGPNGSGKTTTIRMLLGLVAPTAGRMTLLGGDVPAMLPTTLRRVGAIVEGPALFPAMTGGENLRVLARIDGIGRARVEEVLGLVGLADAAGRMVRGYSLGMRQRLGLAAALLKDPALLILDEPANGLDPAGIRDVRRLMRSLADEGRTVFVSSHVLAEVESVCDEVAILRRGRCVQAGPVGAVLSSRGPEDLVVGVDDLPAALRVLARAGMEAVVDDGHLRVVLPGDLDSGEITRILAAEDVWVTELRRDERSLEDIFLELTETEEVGA